VSQIFVERGQFFVIHSSDVTPWHLLSQLMAIWVRASAHCGDEFLPLPLLDQIQPGPDRGDLTWLTAVQISAVAFAAILITTPVNTGLPSGSRPAPNMMSPSKLK